MIQRYDCAKDYGINIGCSPWKSGDGEYVRYADIEPLLPRWVACAERLPDATRAYQVVAHGTRSIANFDAIQRRWFGWFRNDEVQFWLDFQIPPLPASAAEVKEK